MGLLLGERKREKEGRHCINSYVCNLSAHLIPFEEVSSSKDQLMNPLTHVLMPSRRFPPGSKIQWTFNRVSLMRLGLQTCCIERLTRTSSWELLLAASSHSFTWLMRSRHDFAVRLYFLSLLKDYCFTWRRVIVARSVQFLPDTLLNLY